jgi:poly(3-hydroxybutyrate) depolymerase
VVALPDAPNGGVIAGCWDYFDTNHTRSNRHNDNILALVETLRARTDLNIDLRQIYLSGFSSGGGQSMVMACLAPDVFAGVGIDAGPTLGTAATQIGSVATTQSAAAALCQSLAADSAGHLQTQLVSVVYGTSDFLVAQDYSGLNARVFAQIQGATQKAGTVTISGGGTETRWDRNGIKTVQLIRVANLGHALPAGAGSSGGAFIEHATINYPAVLTRYLFCANSRIPGDRGNCDDAANPGVPGNPGNPPTLYCGTDSNANHALAGRAVQYGSGPFASFGAKGSFLWLGYADAQTTLQETSPGHLVIAASCS